MPLIKSIKKLFTTFKYEELYNLHISDAIVLLKKERPGLYIIIYRETDLIPFGKLYDTIRLFTNAENKVTSYYYG